MQGADLTGRWPVSTMSTFRPRRTASTPAAPASRGTVVGLWGHRGAWRWSLSARDLYPHPHRREPQPRAEARAAYGPETEIDGVTAGRGSLRRRAQGATLAELARSYDVSTSTISQLTR
jgi:hypothetical protein